AMLPCPMQEAGGEGYRQARSVHLAGLRVIAAGWRNDELAAKWRKVRQVRSVITGALELERANKTIGSSLEAVPVVHVTDEALRQVVRDIDLAEISITSDLVVSGEDAPAGAFTLREVPGVAVVIEKAVDRNLR